MRLIKKLLVAMTAFVMVLFGVVDDGPSKTNASGGGNASGAAKEDGESKPKRTGNKDDVVEVKVSRKKYPESCKHIEDAINGKPPPPKPAVLTKKSTGAASRRRASLKGTPRKKDFDRDEYPMAMTAEGGTDASIRHIAPSDNRGAGSVIGHQLRKYTDGTKFRIVIV